MRKLTPMTICCAIFLFFISASLSAGQSFFNAGELDRFLKDLPDIPGLTAQSVQNMEEVQQGSVDQEKWAKEMITQSQTAIQKKGWSSERFYYIYSHVMMVFSIENIDRVMKSVAPQMAEAMKAIQNNAHLSQAQKDEMLQQMSQGMSGTHPDIESLRDQVKNEVPPSERRLVQSRYSDICRIFGLPENPGAGMQRTN